MQITVMQDVVEGLYDPDYKPQVYSGHLSEDEVRALAMENVNPSEGLYEMCHLQKTDYGYIATYSHNPNAEIDEEGCVMYGYRGALTVYFLYTSLQISPSDQTGTGG